MRIMDCALLLFQRKLDPLTMDPDRPGPKPSWGESLKVGGGVYIHTFVFIGMAFDPDDLPNVGQPLLYAACVLLLCRGPSDLVVKPSD